MAITLEHYLVVAALLLTIGLFGILLNRRNVIIILMSVELILLSVNVNLIAFSTELGDLTKRCLGGSDQVMQQALGGIFDLM